MKSKLRLTPPPRCFIAFAAQANPNAAASRGIQQLEMSISSKKFCFLTRRRASKLDHPTRLLTQAAGEDAKDSTFNNFTCRDPQLPGGN